MVENVTDQRLGIVGERHVRNIFDTIAHWFRYAYYPYKETRCPATHGSDHCMGFYGHKGSHWRWDGKGKHPWVWSHTNLKET